MRSYAGEFDNRCLTVNPSGIKQQIRASEAIHMAYGIFIKYFINFFSLFSSLIWRKWHNGIMMLMRFMKVKESLSIWIGSKSEYQAKILS